MSSRNKLRRRALGIKKPILLATSNKGKIRELQAILGEEYQVYSKADVGLSDFDTVEDMPTLEGNAMKKAKELYEQLKEKMPVLADDTGLFVDVLHGEPGVLSARYAGDHDDRQNVAKLLHELGGAEQRSAVFETVVAYIDKNGERLFVGSVEGTIPLEERGENRFGYDSVFIPSGYTQTFGEMEMKLKNKISQRGVALQKLLKFLSSIE